MRYDQNFITGVIECWTLHILTEFVDVKELKLRCPRAIPMIMTGRIIEDNLARFCPGSAIQTSWLVGFDLLNMQVMTLNSVYQLKGLGFFSFSQPENYDLEVGKAMLRIAELKNEIMIH